MGVMKTEKYGYEVGCGVTSGVMRGGVCEVISGLWSEIWVMEVVRNWG